MARTRGGDERLLLSGRSEEGRFVRWLPTPFARNDMLFIDVHDS